MPGTAFLRNIPSPTKDDFRRNRYWQNCLTDLRKAYRDVCAYTAIWLSTNASVDHFWPKSIRPDLAYEWSNYRLSLDKVNAYKGSRTDVLDPFVIQPGWFVLDFATFFVLPGVGLPTAVANAVSSTIEGLRLNRDDSLVKLRYSVTKEYADCACNYDFLLRRYPFIASELARQGMIESIRGTL